MRRRACMEFIKERVRCDEGTQGGRSPGLLVGGIWIPLPDFHCVFHFLSFPRFDSPSSRQAELVYSYKYIYYFHPGPPDLSPLLQFFDPN